VAIARSPSAIRRAQQQTPALTRSRLFIAGPIPLSKTAAEGRKVVDALGSHRYRQDPDRRHARCGPHRQAVRRERSAAPGADLIAHGVHDEEIDAGTIALLKKNGAFYCPALMYEVSTYADRPAFLDDPFLLKDVHRAALMRAPDPQFQENMRASKSAGVVSRAPGHRRNATSSACKTPGCRS
jgi:hypothetical protein